MTRFFVNQPMQKCLALVLVLTMTLLPLLSSATPTQNSMHKEPATQTTTLETQVMQVTSQSQHDCCDPADCQCGDECQCQLQASSITPQLMLLASTSPVSQAHYAEPVSLSSLFPDNLFRPPILV